MTGVVLAGGLGTRLRPLTLVANKHLLPVYDRPMIYYPIQTLKDIGCDEVVIVSGGENIGGFAELLKDGSDFRVRLTYRVQNEANGIAGALACVEGLVDGCFPVILGDNFFETAPGYIEKPLLLVKSVPDAERFGVYANGHIVEKPEEPESDKAVTGFYVYDTSVFDYIRRLKPSKRNELEIADVNEWYLQQGCTVAEYRNYWSDLGTFESLRRTVNFIARRSGHED